MFALIFLDNFEFVIQSEINYSSKLCYPATLFNVVFLSCRNRGNEQSDHESMRSMSTACIKVSNARSAEQIQYEYLAVGVWLSEYYKYDFN